MQTNNTSTDTAPRGHRRGHLGQTVEIPAMTIAQVAADWQAIQRAQAELDSATSVVYK